MQQLSKTRSILYHLYPGIIIAVCFVILTPVLLKYDLPPQFTALVAIAIAAMPLFSENNMALKKQAEIIKMPRPNASCK